MKICEAGRDPCGCNNWAKGIRTINGQYPDDNRDFDINAGDGIEVTPATGGITIAMKAPISGPMIYRGTVGTGGTIATLPDANVENSGWVYVAVTAGSTPDDTPVSYNVGDLLISNGQEWTVVPAGDDPYVTLDTAQTITGQKTLDVPSIATAEIIKNTRIVFKNPNIPDTVTTPTSDIPEQYIAFSTNEPNNERNLSTFGYFQDAAGNGIADISARRYTNNNTQRLRIVSLVSGGGYASAPYRAYDSANVNDIVTIGSLAANPNVVHTTGNESLTGTKTFTGAGNERISIKQTASGTAVYPILFSSDLSGADRGEAYFKIEMVSSKIVFKLAVKNGNNTWKEVTLATADN